MKKPSAICRQLKNSIHPSPILISSLRKRCAPPGRLAKPRPKCRFSVNSKKTRAPKRPNGPDNSCRKEKSLPEYRQAFVSPRFGENSCTSRVLNARNTRVTLSALGVHCMQGTESCPHTRRFGVFEVDLRAAELRKRGVRIKLQEQPFRILSLLLEHPGEVVTREELREKLWPAHTFVDFDRSLNKAMTKLRSALADSAESPRYVETVPRHGYRILASVQTDPDGSAAKNGASRAPSFRGSIDVAHTASGSSAIDEKSAASEIAENLATPSASPSGNVWRRLRARPFHLAFYAVLAMLAIFTYLRLHQPVVLGVSPSAVSPRRSVAVLALKNLSGDTQEAWLSTAFSDWLLTELTAGEQLRVIPGENVARMKMELALPDVDSLGGESLSRIRKNLGTDFVVVGAYAAVGGKSDGQIRLDLRLQDTRSGETIAANSETGTESHMLDLVSRAGEHLRRKLGVRAVTSEEAAEVAIALPSKSETAKLYSQGLMKLRVFDALAARGPLVQTVAAQPDYGPSDSGM